MLTDTLHRVPRADGRQDLPPLIGAVELQRPFRRQGNRRRNGHVVGENVGGGGIRVSRVPSWGVGELLFTNQVVRFGG